MVTHQVLAVDEHQHKNDDNREQHTIQHLRENGDVDQLGVGQQEHGARAAYETLLRSNYQIERWERPLSELAATAGPETVVIFAQPFSRE